MNNSLKCQFGTSNMRGDNWRVVSPEVTLPGIDYYNHPDLMSKYQPHPGQSPAGHQLVVTIMQNNGFVNGSISKLLMPDFNALIWQSVSKIIGHGIRTASPSARKQ